MSTIIKWGRAIHWERRGIIVLKTDPPPRRRPRPQGGGLIRAREAVHSYESGASPPQTPPTRGGESGGTRPAIKGGRGRRNLQHSGPNACNSPGFIAVVEQHSGVAEIIAQAEHQGKGPGAPR